jgi:hypothetical protein
MSDNELQKDTLNKVENKTIAKFLGSFNEIIKNEGKAWVRTVMSVS